MTDEIIYPDKCPKCGEGTFYGTALCDNCDRNSSAADLRAQLAEVKDAYATQKLAFETMKEAAVGFRDRTPDTSALAALRALVVEQAEDEGLWAVHLLGTQPITEAYLQQELRKLHDAVEKAVPARSEKDPKV